MSSGAQYRQRRITNWPEYNRALVKRGSITFWLPEDVASIWFYRGEHHGRGLSKTFSDEALQTCLMLRLVFNLPLRGMQGFVDSLFGLVGLPLRCPNYTLFSKRARHMGVRIPRRLPEGPLDVVVDSTGLKVFGEGEWKVRKHGVGKRRTWRKLHLGVDAVSHEIVAGALTDAGTGDGETLPGLLEQLEGEDIGRVTGDGGYDTQACYESILAQGAEPCIPPRETAVDWAPEHPRTAAKQACERLGRRAWKRATGYHRRSLSETAMYRFKQLIGQTLRARVFPNQVAETYVGIAVLNEMSALGMPRRA